MMHPALIIETFRVFAKALLQKLKNELTAPYQNQEQPVHDVMQQAIVEHQQTFQKELQEKIEELVTEENQYLKPALTDMKERFMEKLR